MKVLVAMSGGVDSSVAAGMLARDGHEVTGVHLRLADVHGPTADGRVHGCCGVTDADDARRVAQVLDIPFYVWSLTDEFARGVVDDLVAEYAQGRTPNPCVRCNEVIKFGVLLERARRLGFDALATGHYAVRWGARLFRAADRAKDQSYVLARTTRSELARALFPVGSQTKDETRALARDLGLRVASKPDSYDICFVPDGDTAGFVERELGGPRPGAVVDPSGEVIGEHAGVHRFTIGQRRGLGLATHERTYVLDIDAESNRVIVGPEQLLARREILAERVRWIGSVEPARVTTVQLRAHGEVFDASVDVDGTDSVVVRLSSPARGVAPGQLIAFYDDDEVLGGGTIARALA